MNDIMNATAGWESPVYRQTVLIVLVALFIGALVNFLFRQKNQYSMLPC